MIKLVQISVGSRQKKMFTLPVSYRKFDWIENPITS